MAAGKQEKRWGASKQAELEGRKRGVRLLVLLPSRNEAEQAVRQWLV